MKKLTKIFLTLIILLPLHGYSAPENPLSKLDLETTKQFAKDHPFILGLSPFALSTLIILSKKLVKKYPGIYKTPTDAFKSLVARANNISKYNTLTQILTLRPLTVDTPKLIINNTINLSKKYPSIYQLPFKFAWFLAKEAAFAFTAGAISRSEYIKKNLGELPKEATWGIMQALRHTFGGGYGNQSLVSIGGSDGDGTGEDHGEGLKTITIDDIKEKYPDGIPGGTEALPERLKRGAGILAYSNNLLKNYGNNPNARSKLLGKGFVLYGPPGTGKSNTIDALVLYLAEQGVEVSIKDWKVKLSKYINESSNRVEKVFEQLTAGTYIIRIDEIDKIASKRDEKDKEGAKVINTLLSYVEGGNVKQGVQVIVIGTTNRPDQLDDALLGTADPAKLKEKFDKIGDSGSGRFIGIKMENPTEKAIAESLEFWINGAFLESKKTKLSKEFYQNMGKQLFGISQRGIVHITQKLYEENAATKGQLDLKLSLKNSYIYKDPATGTIHTHFEPVTSLDSKSKKRMDLLFNITDTVAKKNSLPLHEARGKALSILETAEHKVIDHKKFKSTKDKKEFFDTTINNLIDGKSENGINLSCKEFSEFAKKNRKKHDSKDLYNKAKIYFDNAISTNNKPDIKNLSKKFLDVAKSCARKKQAQRHINKCMFNRLQQAYEATIQSDKLPENNPYAKDFSLENCNKIFIKKAEELNHKKQAEQLQLEWQTKCKSTYDNYIDTLDDLFTQYDGDKLTKELSILTNKLTIHLEYRQEKLEKNKDQYIDGYVKRFEENNKILKQNIKVLTDGQKNLKKLEDTVKTTVKKEKERQKKLIQEQETKTPWYTACYEWVFGKQEQTSVSKRSWTQRFFGYFTSFFKVSETKLGKEQTKLAKQLKELSVDTNQPEQYYLREAGDIIENKMLVPNSTKPAELKIELEKVYPKEELKEVSQNNKSAIEWVQDKNSQPNKEHASTITSLILEKQKENGTNIFAAKEFLRLFASLTKNIDIDISKPSFISWILDTTGTQEIENISKYHNALMSLLIRKKDGLHIDLNKTKDDQLKKDINSIIKSEAINSYHVKLEQKYNKLQKKDKNFRIKNKLIRKNSFNKQIKIPDSQLTNVSVVFNQQKKLNKFEKQIGVFKNRSRPNNLALEWKKN